MNQKEPLDCTVKDHHLDLLVSFDCRNDLVHLRKHLWTEDVQRREVKRDSPILGRAPDQTYFSSLCCCVILIFHVVVSYHLVSSLILRYGRLMKLLRHAALVRWSHIGKLG